MLIVFYADKKCTEYENILDIIFLTSGLINPSASPQYEKPSSHLKMAALSEDSMLSLRSGICLIIEETLLTLETGIGRGKGKEQGSQLAAGPKYFQRDEFQDVDQDNGPILETTEHGKF